jgi:SAM-dependent MidA family methyltransferase
MPQRFSGIVFSNEFFDAVPVDLIAVRDGRFVERRVTFDGARFVWIDGRAMTESAPDDLGSCEEGTLVEVQTHRLRWLDRINDSLESGLIVTIDYGFTRREQIRFPHGTLMSYRGHQASDDVLATPGDRDISAHVSFTELEEHGKALGWRTVAFETLTHALMRAGERDEFSEALFAENDTERRKHRLQLKSLLVGMGETFRVLVQQK